jgi:transposase
MSKASGLTRGDKRRNQRLERLRAAVPGQNAVVAVDLGEDTQMLVVADHDSRVLARKVAKVKAHRLGEALDWAARQAARGGFASVTVACEPTGSRWMQVADLAAARGLSFVCVQPLATHLAREAEDYTRDKSDYKDAVLIARLAAQLRCYLPERIEPAWALLRHLGRRRARLITTASGCVLQLRDLLGLAWPAVLDAAACPFESTTWLAALAVVLGRCDGDPARLRRLGPARFEAAVRGELGRWGGQRPRRRIIAAVFAALARADGAVAAHRRGALQRAAWALGDLREARGKLTQAEALMCAQLEELGLAELVTTIPGLSAVAAAAILAETGDPARFTAARSVVKHGGLSPAENTSAAFRGHTRLSRRGRPGLRLAAWRAAWAVLRHNPILAARYQHLTTRPGHRLTRGQAHAACAATLLRWLHAITTTGQAWDPAIAAGLPAATQVTAA